MSKKDEALKLALEQAYLAGFNASADGYNGECGVGNASQCTQWLTERDNYIRKALAEQTAQQQEPVAWFELLREARDNCKASIVEEGISASRKEYRIDLEARLTTALNTPTPASKPVCRARSTA